MKELEQKGTLRKVNEGIVFTIDERPSKGEHYYSLNTNKIRKCRDDDTYPAWQTVIASTFGVGLELDIEPLDKKIEFNLGLIDNVFNTEYPYTIQDNKVIIEL